MKRKIPFDTAYFHYYNANPKDKQTADCVIRAISTATNKSWDDVLSELYQVALKHKLMLNDKKCYKKYLESLGWVQEKQPRKADNTKYTGKEFCNLLDNKNSKTIIAHIGTHHLVCIKKHAGSHKIFDTWNSSYDRIGTYWVKP